MFLKKELIYFINLVLSPSIKNHSKNKPWILLQITTAFLLQIYDKVNDKWNDMCGEKNAEKNSWCELNPRPSNHWATENSVVSRSITIKLFITNYDKIIINYDRTIIIMNQTAAKIPVVIGDLGLIKKVLQKYVQRIPGNIKIHEL